MPTLRSEAKLTPAPCPGTKGEAGERTKGRGGDASKPEAKFMSTTGSCLFAFDLLGLPAGAFGQECSGFGVRVGSS